MTQSHIARLLAALIAWIVLVPSMVLAVDLTGRVTDAEGQPVSGAKAFIYTAGVREGTSPYCPSCYPDCGKISESDADGQFTLRSLDPTLLFRVLLVADGYEPAMLDKVDPAAGAVTATLEPRPSLPDDVTRVIQGRVTDELGEPVVGATVEVAQRRLPGGITTGYPEGIDLVVFTDEQGAFAIVADEPILSVGLLVRARNLAPHKFVNVAPGEEPVNMRLTRGHMFTGQVVKDGTPLAGVVIGLVQLNRDMDANFVGETTAVTDDEGVYHFFNAPPDDKYVVYGKMAGVALRGGGIATRDVASGRDGATTRLDDLEIEPAHTIEGRVALADGKPLPAQTRLIVGRKQAWDSQIVPLDADGTFRVAGLPTEVYSLVVQVRGYRVSAKNRSLDLLNPWGLKGLVDHDLAGIELVMEPGAPSMPDFRGTRAQQQAMHEAYRALDSTPLAGVE